MATLRQHNAALCNSFHRIAALRRIAVCAAKRRQVAHQPSHSELPKCNARGVIVGRSVAPQCLLPAQADCAQWCEMVLFFNFLHH
jgi:hypothetical protein